MVSQSIVQVDAFTDVPFRGNPAGVCILDAPREEAWMQAVAAEMNLAETAFLSPQDGGYLLRWFTPVTEVALCGHATLASAHVLWTEGALPETAVARFHTMSGMLTATKHGDWITMDFPSEPAESVKEAPLALLAALGVEPTYVGKNRFDYLVEVTSEDVVRGLSPDFELMKSLEQTRGVMVTSLSKDGTYDFVSRFFVPSVGVNEDPVTGSAHCCLAPHWQSRLGKNPLVGYQCSKRGGVVKAQVQADRILLSGQAVTVLKGHII